MILERPDAASFVATLLGVLLLASLSPGCASSSSSIPDPKPLPEGEDFEGVWYSPQFEHMYIRQNGQDVRAVYTYEDGGRLEGTVDGNLLKFKWVDPGSKRQAERTMSGRGYLQLVRRDDQVELVGEWGYDEDHTGGGPWEAEYVRELEDGDPSSVEEIEASD